jgi:hypothetical protein
VDFWRKSNKPPFDSLQSFLGLHFASGIIAWSAASPDLMKNQPIGPLYTIIFMMVQFERI